MTTENSSSIPIDELIRQCTETGSREAWEEFVRRVHSCIAMVALRTARRWGEDAPAIIDDLVQETFLKICSDGARILRELEIRRPEAVFAFIKVVTANVCHDHFKALHSEKRGGRSETDVLDDAISPSLETNREGSAESIERKILIKEIDSCLTRQLEEPTVERDRMIFWFYYRHGMAARAISDLPFIGLSTKGVESVILRLTRLVRKELTEHRLREPSPEDKASGKGFRSAESL